MGIPSSPDDREQVIKFLFARGDERDKQINDLTEANGVLRNTITTLQNEKAELEKKLSAAQVPPQTGEATPGA